MTLASRVCNDTKQISAHKVQQFIENIRVLDELAKDSPDIEILKSYKGFGGLKRCFWDRTLYGQLMRAIRSNVGRVAEKEVLESLRNTSNSAYYTPKPVIDFMYRYLEQVCNFTGGDILEPSCGNGAFFEYMPESIKNNSTVRGIECDTLTAKITKKIYPHVEMIYDKLQDYQSEKQFDLIIGNPPYSAEKITDNLMPDISGFSIHHYFIARCVRLLKDEGILAFVMPSFFMDIPRGHTRHIIDNEAVLIDAVRLPDNLFDQATVTVDLVFIRKTGNKVHNFVETTEFKQGNNQDLINEYWTKNPNRVLGELKLKWVDCYKRYVPTCNTENKAQALQYLSVCDFKADTMANYVKITGNNTQANKNSNTTNNNALLIEINNRMIKLAENIEETANKLDQEKDELDNLKYSITELMNNISAKQKLFDDYLDDLNILSAEIFELTQ